MSLPVISVQQMREWERATWASGQTEAEVIARVGKCVAEHSLRLTQNGDKILILAGKGHNGDDARAALPHLHEREIVVIDVTDPAIAIEIFKAACDAAQEPNLILDGMFGIGLSRPLSEPWQNLIATINETEIPVVSIDVPSGLDAETGEIRGAAIRASITLTVGAPKIGMFSPQAVPFVSRLEVAADVGLVPCPFSSELNWTTPVDFKNFPPSRKTATHKGTYGHVAIFAGSLGYHGAAVLSARGALRAQPGLVTVFTPANVYIPVASQLQAAMVHPWQSAREVPDSCSAILFGPGFAARDLPHNLKRELIDVWNESPLPVVVDASALDWLPPGGNFQNAIRVITPHPGEAARMLCGQDEHRTLNDEASAESRNVTSTNVQDDRVSALRKLSARYGNCFVVLKGHQTLVGRNEGDVFINSSGNPFLAQGGSGDVLAGYLSGLLAQRNLQVDILKTIRYAVWQHGATADFLTETKSNWTIDDLLEVVGKAFQSAGYGAFQSRGK